MKRKSPGFLRHFGIQGKLTFLFIFLSTIPLTLLGIYIINTQIDSLKTENLQKIKTEIHELKDRTSMFFSQVKNVIDLSTNTSVVVDLMNFLETGDVPPAVRIRAEKELLRLLDNKHYYIKVQILDNRANEIVTIFFKDGKPFLIPRQLLYETPLWFYYYAVKDLNRGEIVTLPSEMKHPLSDEILQAISLIIPLYNQKNELLSIFIAHIDFKEFRQKLNFSNRNVSGKIAIVNNEGLYLYNSTTHKLNKILDSRSEMNLSNDYSREIAEQIQSGRDGTISWLPGKIIEYASIFSGDIGRTFGYTIFLDVPTAIIFSGVRQMRILFILLVFSAGILSIITGFLCARYFLKPIKNLIQGAKSVKEGNFDFQFTFKSKDELQDLVEGFNILLQSAQKFLKDSEEKFRSLVKIDNDAIISSDSEGKIIFWNNAAEKIFGYTAMEALGKNTTIIIPGHLRHSHKKGIEKSMDSKIRNLKGKTFEALGLRKDGSEIPLELSMTAWKTSHGIFFTSIIRDVTERKRAEDELRESEDRFHQIFEQDDSPVIIFNPENLKIIDINPAALELYGYKKNEIKNKDISLLFVESNAAEFKKIAASIGNRKKFNIRMIDSIKANESIMKVKVRGKLIKLKRTSVIYCNVVDLTEIILKEKENRMIQEKLAHTNKMASIGTLASGVAHEINNPNNSIMINIAALSEMWENLMPVIEQYHREHSDFTVRGIPYPEVVSQILRLFSGISTSSQRIKTIVGDLKDFAKPRVIDLNKCIQVNEVIDSALSLIDNLLAKSTNHFSADLNTALPKVKGNFQKLEQVMINLLQNACQALQDREKKIRVTSSFNPETKSIVLKVEDEGIGIPSENLELIMDPFFTTKRKDGGTGLGLSIASGIIRDHGGKLELSSEPGKGTTVIVNLPVVDKDINESTSKEKGE